VFDPYSQDNVATDDGLNFESIAFTRGDRNSGQKTGDQTNLSGRTLQVARKVTSYNTLWIYSQDTDFGKDADLLIDRLLIMYDYGTDPLVFTYPAEKFGNEVSFNFYNYDFFQQAQDQKQVIFKTREDDFFGRY